MQWTAAFALAWIAVVLPTPATAQVELPPGQDAQPPAQQTAGPHDDDCAATDPDECKQKKRKQRLFPIGAEKAEARGFHVPRPWGLGGILIDNTEDMSGLNLAVSVAKGDVEPPETLTSIPFVTTDQLRSHTTNTQFKADLWVIPGIDLFLAFGKAKGTVDVGVNINLDEFLPPPICRPADPCGSVHLPFVAKVDNATTTIGAIGAYGGRNWFVAGSVAKTLSISSKERSDIETFNAGLRAGPRFQLGRSFLLSPYVGANYFKMDTTITGVFRTGPVFPDGDAIALRYSLDVTTENPWGYLVGANAELGRAWTFQVEYAGGHGTRRVIVGLGLRI